MLETADAEELHDIDRPEDLPGASRPINLQNETSLPEQTPLVPAVSIFYLQVFYNVLC